MLIQMNRTEKIIERCKQNDSNAQKELYDIYAPVLFGVCLRYTAEHTEAQDVLQDGFIKILTKISDYTGIGSFEGWMKRIVINTAISLYHKNKKHNQTSDIAPLAETYLSESEVSENEYTAEELMSVINKLPTGYKAVFSMYAIEGYKHKEIAELLEIDINTSKSQYSRAKKMIQIRLEELSKIRAYRQISESQKSVIKNKA